MDAFTRRALLIGALMSGVAPPADASRFITRAAFGGGQLPGTPLPLTEMRATNAGFGMLSELAPSAGKSQTSRAITPAFNEPFRNFRIVYATFRIRALASVASIDGTTATVTTITAGGWYPGVVLAGTNVAAGTYIVAQLSGTPGGVGTYQVSISQTAASAAITSAAGWLMDEPFREAPITYDAGFADSVTPGYTALPQRQRVTFDGGASTHVYDYATADKSVGYFTSDLMSRAAPSSAPMEIWTRCQLPANQSGLPAMQGAQNAFVDRGWGNDLQTGGASVDPVTGSSIPSVSTNIASFTQVITPIALIIYTAGKVKTVVTLGDSRASYTGLGINEPAGHGDKNGDAQRLASSFERGIHGVAKQHCVMLGKPSEKAFNLARSPAAWAYRRQLLALLNPQIVISALGQNDQNPATDIMAAWSSGMDLPLGTTVTTSNRIYVVTTAGVSGTTAPTSTTIGSPVALGTATVQYLGTDAAQDTRMGMAIAGKNLVINAAIRAAVPAVQVIQDNLAPYTTSVDNYATAAGQSDNFHTAAGIAYQAKLAANGAIFAGADRIIDQIPFLAGSRTVNGGPNDGTRTWKTDPSGGVPYFTTQDGIHHGNLGAELGKMAFTKLALAA